jgi:hypothetical protein
MSANGDFTELSSDEIFKMQRKRARSTALVLGSSAIISLILALYALVLKQETRKLNERIVIVQNENQNLKEQLELCQSR